MSHEPPLDDPDDDIIPSGTISTRGLPPCRAQLAHFMAYRQAVAADVSRLEAGRDRLVLEIAKADAAKAQADEAFETAAVTLADSIKAGAEIMLAAFTGKPKPAPSIDPKLTRAALAKLEADLTAKLALSDRLADRSGEFISGALREHGADLGKEYLALLDALRNTIGRLHSLDVVCGGPAKRDVRGMLPGFSAAGQPMRSIQVGPGEEAIIDGIARWKALAKRWVER
jgi:hypothetical protein